MKQAKRAKPAKLLVIGTCDLLPGNFATCCYKVLITYACIPDGLSFES